MKLQSNRYVASVFAAVLVAGAAGLPAFAAGQGQAPARAPKPNSAAGMRSVAEIARRISEASGVQVVADSSVASVQVPLPAEATTAENFERQVAALAEAAGKDATWGKLYLPAPPAGARGYKGDDVAAFASAQARLFGRVGDAPAGSVEILGKVVPAAEAEGYVRGLGLQPVYLITNPRAAEVSGQWAAMTEEQRNRYAEQQAARLATADDATRQGWMQEHMAVMRQLMGRLSPDQRNAMFGPNGGVRVIMRTPEGTFESSNGQLPPNVIVRPAP